jgi:hypothetical protein
LIPGAPELNFGGFSHPRIQEIVMDIDNSCINKNIDRRTFWVPRELNKVADYVQIGFW